MAPFLFFFSAIERPPDENIKVVHAVLEGGLLVPVGRKVFLVGVIMSVVLLVEDLVENKVCSIFLLKVLVLLHKTLDL